MPSHLLVWGRTLTTANTQCVVPLAMEQQLPPDRGLEHRIKLVFHARRFIQPIPRPRLAIALDNAVEGCVRETMGAVLAHVQAQTATDPVVRRVMTHIAVDETQHAVLSWRLAEWLHPQLSADERGEVASAQERALAQLTRELGTGLPTAARELIGYPSPRVCQQLVLQLRATMAT